MASKGGASNARRMSAMANVMQKRQSIAAPVNLKALVRVYLLDGSSKVLQMFEHSTAEEVMIQLRYNLDLKDISTFALFEVKGSNIRRIELDEKVAQITSATDTKILFKSWITLRSGTVENAIFQYGIKTKQPNAELWVSYMEAMFLMMSGKYLLTEDEAMILGCLKMQAESGDFNPAVHTTDVIKEQVALRFPAPISDRVKSLMRSAKSRNAQLADDIANRALLAYARLAGKSKIDAQVDILNTLRTWCPFYGATYFHVQCQYDDTPLDKTRQPPIIAMEVAIGPHAIYLITPTTPPTIMRHPYNRILRWIAHPDKQIFAYWVVKPSLDLSDIDDALAERSSRGTNFDCNNYCDCVYLVSNHAKEIEHVVRSYVHYENKDILPYLPDAPIELQPVVGNEDIPSDDQDMSQSQHTDEVTPESSPEKDSTAGRNKKNRMSVFFKSLAGYGDEDGADANMSGSGYVPGSTQGRRQEGAYRDEAPGVANSVFKSAYANGKSGGGGGGSNNNNVKYASSMAELQKVANEKNFSEDENSDSDDQGKAKGDSSDDDAAGSDDDVKGSNAKPTAAAADAQKPKEGAFFRRMFFGSSNSSNNNARTGKNNEDSD